MAIASLKIAAARYGLIQKMTNFKLGYPAFLESAKRSAYFMCRTARDARQADLDVGQFPNRGRRASRSGIMKESTKSGCLFKNRFYPHDSEVCSDDHCMICKDGEWKDASSLFPDKESGNLSP
jgi:hypothetical protein